MIKSVLSFLLVLVFSGCASSVGRIETHTSEFDGTTETILTPAWVCHEETSKSCDLQFGLNRRSNMPPEDVELTVRTPGNYMFVAGESLKFNIDGETVSVASISNLTDYNFVDEYHNVWSSQRYLINKTLLSRLLNAKRVAVHVELKDGYREGIFSRDARNAARPAFREYYQKVFAAPL